MPAAWKRSPLPLPHCTATTLPTKVGIGTATTKEQSQRRVRNLVLIMVFNDRPTFKDRHAAELILAKGSRLQQKAEYTVADLSSRQNWPLRSRGRPYIFITYPLNALLNRTKWRTDSSLF